MAFCFIYAWYEIFVLKHDSISFSSVLFIIGYGTIIVMFGFGIGLAVFNTKTTILYSLLASIMFSAFTLIAESLEGSSYLSSDTYQIPFFIYLILIGPFLSAGILRVFIGQQSVDEN